MSTLSDFRVAESGNRKNAAGSNAQSLSGTRGAGSANAGRGQGTPARWACLHTRCHQTQYQRQPHSLRRRLPELPAQRQPHAEAGQGRKNHGERRCRLFGFARTFGQLFLDQYCLLPAGRCAGKRLRAVAEPLYALSTGKYRLAGRRFTLAGTFQTSPFAAGVRLELAAGAEPPQYLRTFGHCGRSETGHFARRLSERVCRQSEHPQREPNCFTQRPLGRELPGQHLAVACRLGDCAPAAFHRPQDGAASRGHVHEQRRLPARAMAYLAEKEARAYSGCR